MENRKMDSRIVFDESGQYLVTKNSDGSISSEPISSEEASQWQSENNF